MFIVIGIMFMGILLGFLLRQQKLSDIHRIITVLIWLLLFLLGIDVGGNQKIIQGLHTLGMEALAITLAAVLGSAMAAWALWYTLYKKKNKEGRI
ncbi:MAG: lysine exporter LysO family protein [Phocaeicola sp.]|uniref:LysO family transporter n=1 Tax=Phocaeicola sp. TaxID=2773926 RepID=UPI0023C15C72|nr:LysO family transporter [Phocaeicola sp.]MDE5676529.1 lysine exporter LysO family protein [Phocaeicola sp.]MDE6181025.1 lysine exporter LysO family protein [Phocaeicola sp.]